MRDCVTESERERVCERERVRERKRGCLRLVRRGEERRGRDLCFSCLFLSVFCLFCSVLCSHFVWLCLAVRATLREGR